MGAERSSASFPGCSRVPERWQFSREDSRGNFRETPSSSIEWRRHLSPLLPPEGCWLLPSSSPPPHRITFTVPLYGSIPPHFTNSVVWSGAEFNEFSGMFPSPRKVAVFLGRTSGQFPGNSTKALQSIAASSTRGLLAAPVVLSAASSHYLHSTRQSFFREITGVNRPSGQCLHGLLGQAPHPGPCAAYVGAVVVVLLVAVVGSAECMMGLPPTR